MDKNMYLYIYSQIEIFVKFQNNEKKKENHTSFKGLGGRKKYSQYTKFQELE